MIEGQKRIIASNREDEGRLIMLFLCSLTYEIPETQIHSFIDNSSKKGHNNHVTISRNVDVG